jgi:glucosamine 6-phosphate synthetase-like amidotransferase/phosphosugar isomerase protein
MCGLYGIINNGPKPFRKDIFTVLGITNDRRGGDSCGVFIDDRVEYGIDQRALFENFFWDCDLLNNTEVCEIALGHDRKASIGGITVEKAHPILIKNDEGKIEFVLIHNGTIHNYEELAKEYIPDIDCSKMSDSQVLALILYHKGFEVLDKYNGGTACSSRLS